MSERLLDATSGLEYTIAGDAKNPKRIVILLHGMGSNSEDVQQIGDIMAINIPDSLVIMPTGPISLKSLIPADQLPAAEAANPGVDLEQARSWFGAAQVQGETLGEVMDSMSKGTQAMADQLNKLMDGKIAAYSLKNSDVAVYGFSQGGVLAIQSTIRRKEPVSSVVIHSGYYLGEENITARPPVFFMLGDQEEAGWKQAEAQDNPMADLYGPSAALAFLAHDRITAQKHVCQNLGHGFNDEALGMSINFMRKKFGITRPPAQKLSAPKPPGL